MTDPSRSALIVVDMQNLFVNAVGDAGPGVVKAVNEYVAETAERGDPVFFTRDVQPYDGATDAVKELHPGLDLRGTVVPKGPGARGGFSGFVLLARSGPGIGCLSPLAGHLREAGVGAVTVTGIAADVCVAATARDALRLGYAVTLPLRATAFVHAEPRGDEAAIERLEAAGVTVVR